MTGIALFFNQGKQIYSVVQTHCKKNPEMHHGKDLLNHKLLIRFNIQWKLVCVLFDRSLRKCLAHCFVYVLLTVCHVSALHTVLYVSCLIVCHVSVLRTVSCVLFVCLLG